MVFITEVLLTKQGKEIGWQEIVVGTDSEERIRSEYLGRAVRRYYPDKKFGDFSGYEIKKVKGTRQVVGL